MEKGAVWLIIIVIWVIWKIIESSSRDSEIASIPHFTLKVDRERAPSDHVFAGIECFSIRLNGWFNHPEKSKMKVMLLAHDNTDVKEDEGNGFPMLSSQSFFSEPNSRCFSVQSVYDSKPDLYLQKEFDWIYIPCEFLVAPFKGKRKISFSALIGDETLESDRGSLSPENRDKVVRYSSCIIHHEFKEVGYFENLTFREKIEDLTIELAMAMAASDGTLDQNELNIIKDWSLLGVHGLDEDKQDKRKKHFTEFIKITYKKAKEKKLSMSKILEELNEKANKQQKYEAVDLLLKIIAADNKLSKEEDKLLRTIATKLELDEKVFSDMKNKTLATIGSIETSKGSVEDLLGLNKTMSDQEKCKELRKQYSKWNAQTNNSNENLRKRAQEMVKVIAELRTKYNC